MEELITKLEQAQGPDRELDRAIARAVGWHRVEPRFTSNKKGAWISPEDWIGEYSDGTPKTDNLHGTTMYRDVPPYTSSLDAAETLIPQSSQCPGEPRNWELSGKVQRSDTTQEGFTAVLFLDGSQRWSDDTTESFAATRPLALCLAALRGHSQGT